MSARVSRRTLKIVAGIVAAAVGLAACDAPEPAISDAQPMLRRLTEDQYRNIISDVFGPQIIVAGEFAPILREGDLVAASAARATVSASSFEKLERLAHGIAAQVVDPDNRRLLIGCEPNSAGAADDQCVRQFLASVGRLLYRRPLTTGELDRVAELSATAARGTGDAYGGLAFGLSALLVSPQFLFVADTREAGAGASAPLRLTSVAKATRLSFFLWNTTPDVVLLDAAENGVLDTESGLRDQVARLLGSPRLVDGVRALFADMLALDKFTGLEKDPDIYPAFDPMVSADAREQLLRTISDQLVARAADYRTLFDTSQTFMTPALGRIYRVPVTDPSGWSPFEFPAGSDRQGIQTLAGFVALYAHPGRSSPTIRGKAVRELLLCQKVPDPPGDVDFTLFNAPNSANLIARQRLDAHNTVPTCAGCHKIMDGIGLAFENFDGAGQYRATDAGQAIDVSGDFDGVPFADPAGLAAALKNHPGVPPCLVRRVVAYALSGVVEGPQASWEKYLLERFADNGFRLKPLLEAIVLSPNFFALGVATEPRQEAASVVNSNPEDR
ncbi:MAG: DUF1592 domain-containing protein [Alphaproteobacteria bacterium]|nr:DUF1592 domain-containing protein [Alphaproteobacteria bacterium]